jgi:dUTP pyrophosphatase
MQVTVKRIDKQLPLPVYETKGAAGFDFVARTDVTIEPKAIQLVPGNIVIAIPQGYMLAVFSRSSTPKKKGVMLPHGVGVIDSDYCGPTDEIWIQVMNFTDSPVTIKRGEKIAQGVLLPVEQAEWQEVEEMTAPSRGGRGTTGGYVEENV